MADKEAHVFIIDLGASMGQKSHEREETDLDWSMRFVWDRISDMVASNRKTLCVSVIGLRTDETDNPLMDDDGYENISVLQPLGQLTMSGMKTLKAKIKPSGTLSGDAVSAIVVAVDLIDKFTKTQKWMRKIWLVTDGQAGLDDDDIGDISKKIDDSKIELTVLGVDFDDAEYGFKEEDKSETKKLNERTLRTLVEGCANGTFASIAEAIEDTATPRVKKVKPYKTYDWRLTLGDPEAFPAAVDICVERYFKTHQARPLGASTVVFKEDEGGAASTQTLDGESMDDIEFSAVKQARTYKINDPDAPGGKRDVEFESLAKGYEYGRTAVHISESEHVITKLETTRGFQILGFVPSKKYEPFLNMGETGVTIPSSRDPKASLLFSSLVSAMHIVECYGVARIVVKDGKEPLLVLLIPDPLNGSLYDVPLPFAEDVRGYQFPPLDKVITVSGQTVTMHRLLPSDDLNQAMSNYVDAMDLSTFGTDEDGNPDEYAQVEDVYSPAIHRIAHAVKHRAIYPEAPIPEMPPELMKYATPPSALVELAQSRIDELITAADVKKVPPKAKGKRQRESAKPISGLDVDALLGEGKKGQISPDNAVPDYKRALQVADEVDHIEDATKQLGALVRSLVTSSFGDSKYDQAIESIGTMREELINLEEPAVFNSFMRDLKKNLLSGALGGDRRDFWFKLRWSKLGLIDKEQSEVSTVTPDEAAEFLKSR